MNEHDRRKLDVPAVMETERLMLRTVRAEDGQKFLKTAMASRKRLGKWVHWVNESPTSERIELYCRKSQERFWNREGFEYLIFLQGERQIAGRIGVYPISWDPIMVEFGYWLADDYEGHGYISESVQAMLKMAFENLQAHKVVIRVEKENLRSQNVARRAGFTFEGTIRHYHPGSEDHSRLVDLCFFSLLRSEWRN